MKSFSFVQIALYNFLQLWCCVMKFDDCFDVINVNITYQFIIVKLKCNLVYV